LSPETVAQYKDWMSNEQILLNQAAFQIAQRKELEEASKFPTDQEKIEAWIGGELPPIHIYRAPFDYEDVDAAEANYSAETWAQITEIAARLKEKYRLAIQTGTIDDRSQLEPARAAWFRSRVEQFDPSNYPERVPDIFHEAECNVFGHICPVFFAAEATSERSTERRRGRYISFTVKMRVVRRDNHTCQHCGKHIRHDEVEFDHIIPVAKGGSSEEHNIRLTCFDCNRDKSDEYVP